MFRKTLADSLATTKPKVVASMILSEWQFLLSSYVKMSMASVIVIGYAEASHGLFYFLL
jgi:hypothetical protein